jgi:ferritin-like metal-binding protein YciE
VKPNSPRDLYIDDLRDSCDTENRILKTLPKMAESADALDLRSAFEEHREQSRGQGATERNLTTLAESYLNEGRHIDRF